MGFDGVLNVLAKNSLPAAGLVLGLGYLLLHDPEKDKRPSWVNRQQAQIYEVFGPDITDDFGNRLYPPWLYEYYKLNDPDKILIQG